MRILGVVQYDGTDYVGWQKQKVGDSVQEEIEKVLSKILNTPITIQGSGRTDAGVHALAQHFHFDVEKDITDLDRFTYSVNCLLPDDIHIIGFEVVEPTFHARYDVSDKTYIYTLNVGAYDVFQRKFITQYPNRDLDIDAMKEAAELFKGTHCFKNYTSKEEDEDNFVRTIMAIEVNDANGIIMFRLTADGFMRYMVRIIVGTLIQVGSGKVGLKEIEDSLNESFPRNVMPYKAPPEGLMLVDVNYDKKPFDA